MSVAQGASTAQLGLPADYYERIHAVERSHWWHRGMREIARVLLGERLHRGERLLDAGCGTGGFLTWAEEVGSFSSLAGADIAGEAVSFARAQIPAADLRVAPLDAMPWEDESFDLVACNDVLQHVPAARLTDSVAELRRLVAPGGAVLVRTGGALREREERDDWRIFSARSLRDLLERGGLRCERVTYANLAGSLAATARGSAPRAPSEERHGIPAAQRTRAGDPRFRALGAEARWLSHPERSLPYGHTLLALAGR
ncbi:MAG: class I SAM-dependent methyltransferase [Solirubrobacteraceae bacterium]